MRTYLMTDKAICKYNLLLIIGIICFLITIMIEEEKGTQEEALHSKPRRQAAD